MTLEILLCLRAQRVPLRLAGPVASYLVLTVMYAQSRTHYTAQKATISDPPRRPCQPHPSKSLRPLPADPPYNPDDSPSMALQTSSMSSNSSNHTPSRSQISLSFQSIRDHSPPSPSQSGPLLDQSHRHSGNQTSLLSHECTLELYHTNTKKSQDPTTQFEFAVFMIDASKSYHIPAPLRQAASPRSRRR